MKRANTMIRKIRSDAVEWTLAFDSMLNAIISTYFARDDEERRSPLEYEILPMLNSVPENTSTIESKDRNRNVFRIALSSSNSSATPPEQLQEFACSWGSLRRLTNLSYGSGDVK